MSQAGARGKLNNYRNTGLGGAVDEATPHRLIQMLMEGALDRIAAARGFMERGAIAEKGAQVSWAISIVEGLRVSLDRSMGGDIARNLDDLYGYMIVRLTEANLRNEPAYLDEVADLLHQIRSAWVAMPAETIRAHAAGELADAAGSHPNSG